MGRRRVGPGSDPITTGPVPSRSVARTPRTSRGPLDHPGKAGRGFAKVYRPRPLMARVHALVLCKGDAPRQGTGGRASGNGVHVISRSREGLRRSAARTEPSRCARMGRTSERSSSGSAGRRGCPRQKVPRPPRGSGPNPIAEGPRDPISPVDHPKPSSEDCPVASPRASGSCGERSPNTLGSFRATPSSRWPLSLIDYGTEGFVDRSHDLLAEERHASVEARKRAGHHRYRSMIASRSPRTL